MGNLKGSEEGGRMTEVILSRIILEARNLQAFRLITV
jgi:hypothetical protein